MLLSLVPQIAANGFQVVFRSLPFPVSRYPAHSENPDGGTYCPLPAPLSPGHTHSTRTLGHHAFSLRWPNHWSTFRVWVTPQSDPSGGELHGRGCGWETDRMQSNRLRWGQSAAKRTRTDRLRRVCRSRRTLFNCCARNARRISRQADASAKWKPGCLRHFSRRRPRASFFARETVILSLSRERESTRESSREGKSSRERTTFTGFPAKKPELLYLYFQCDLCAYKLLNKRIYH